MRWRSRDELKVLDDYQDTIRTLRGFDEILADIIFDQILAYAAGKPINVVNPKC